MPHEWLRRALRRDRRAPTVVPAARPAAGKLPPPRDVQQLSLYRNAFTASCQVFALSAAFPAHERLRLTDQLRKSTRSVCANLAEAWQKRRYKAAFVGKLSDASAEAAEAAFWLATAGRCGYLDPPTAARLQRRYVRIAAQLDQLGEESARWCRASDASAPDGASEG